jgi:hypothetical protein
MKAYSGLLNNIYPVLGVTTLFILIILSSCRQATSEDETRLIIKLKNEYADEENLRSRHPDFKLSLLMLEIDFDGDGFKEKLFTSKSEKDEEQNFWGIYKWNGHDWASIGDIEFNDGHYYSGYISELKQEGLIAYSGLNESDRLTAFIFYRGKIARIDFGSREESDTMLHKKYFLNVQSPPPRAVEIK